MTVSRDHDQTAGIALESRMLSGEPFTYGGLCGVYGVEVREAETRLIDRTIQKFRRRGLISFERQGRLTVWSLVSSAAQVERASSRDEH